MRYVRVLCSDLEILSDTCVMRTNLLLCIPERTMFLHLSAILYNSGACGVARYTQYPVCRLQQYKDTAIGDDQVFYLKLWCGIHVPISLHLQTTARNHVF